MPGCDRQVSGVGVWKGVKEAVAVGDSGVAMLVNVGVALWVDVLAGRTVAEGKTGAVAVGSRAGEQAAR